MGRGGPTTGKGTAVVLSSSPITSSGAGNGGGFVEDEAGQKGRRERRKEARLAKQQRRFLSWVDHQSGKKKKENKKSVALDSNIPSEEVAAKKNLIDKCSSGKMISMEKGRKDSKRKSKTKFEEFLEMDMNKGMAGAEEDLKMERRLSKKLKVKGGRMAGFDGIEELFEGIPSVVDTIVDDDGDGKVLESVSPGKKRKSKSQPSAPMSDNETDDDLDDTNMEPVISSEESEKETSSSFLAENLEDESEVGGLDSDEEIGSAGGNGTETLDREEPHMQKPKVDVNVKYVAPHLRANTNNESVEISHIRRRVRGLFNRLSESNMESITEEVATIFQSVARSVGCEVIGCEVIASCSRGPRGNEQYAAVFAAFVTGMSCLVGIDFSAKLIASVAKTFEDEYSKEDGLSLRNLTLLLSYMCTFGVYSSDLIYDLLSVLSERLTEMDVSTILTILQCCGMKLRSDDPTAMKDFIISIQNRANEAKSLSHSGQDGKPKINNKRMEFMLQTICDIKNNKKKPKEDPAHHARIKKWLQKLKAEDSKLCGLTWGKLLDPQKKGQWWLSGEITSTVDNVKEVATAINKEVLEAQKLVQLAAAQRMNTDVRRAIFCIIMSGEDYIDAFEKLLRLDLPGKQDREIMRVLVDCCLQEKVFNKYYIVLASKLCSHGKNHKFTLQYCVWDHYKELDSMELKRSMNLARFVSEMLSSFSLSLAVLRTIDLMDPAQLTPRRIMHFRMLLEAIFENGETLVWNIFTRVAVAPELEMLKDGLLFFIKQYVVTANPGKDIAGKYKIVKKALQNVAGVLM